MKIRVDSTKVMEADSIVISEGYVYLVQEGPTEPVRWFVNVEVTHE